MNWDAGSEAVSRSALVYLCETGGCGKWTHRRKEVGAAVAWACSEHGGTSAEGQTPEESKRVAAAEGVA